jgi:phasin family protein
MDHSERSKLMNKTFQDTLFVPGTASFETLQKFNEINTKTLAKLAELQIHLATFGFETTVEQAKLLSNADNYADLYSVESSLANTYSSKLIEISRETTEILMKSGDEFAAAIEQIFVTEKEAVKTRPVTPVKAATTVTAAKKTVKASDKPAPKPKKVAKKSRR